MQGKTNTCFYKLNKIVNFESVTQSNLNATRFVETPQFSIEFLVEIISLKCNTDIDLKENNKDNNIFHNQ